MLTGNGAYSWARQLALPGVAPDAHRHSCNVTERAHRQWQRYTAMLADGVVIPCGTKTPPPPPSTLVPTAKHSATQAPSHALLEATPDDTQLDTVGSVCVDHHGALTVDQHTSPPWRAIPGRVAATVSSGGIALKSDGRVGEAACYGAGCWARDAKGSTCAGSDTRMMCAHVECTNDHYSTGLQWL